MTQIVLLSEKKWSRKNKVLLVCIFGNYLNFATFFFGRTKFESLYAIGRQYVDKALHMAQLDFDELIQNIQLMQAKNWNSHERYISIRVQIII